MKMHTKIIAASITFILGSALSFAAPASENWENSCAKCHGADGKGQTKIGKKLKLKDYSDAAVQAAMTDEEIIKVTSEGVIQDGKEKMKGFKGEFSESEIKDFVALIRASKA